MAEPFTAMSSKLEPVVRGGGGVVQPPAWIGRNRPSSSGSASARDNRRSGRSAGLAKPDRPPGAPDGGGLEVEALEVDRGTDPGERLADAAAPFQERVEGEPERAAVPPATRRWPAS